MFTRTDKNASTSKYEVQVADTASGIVNLEEKSVTENGEYTPSTGYDGFSKVTVNVPGLNLDSELDITAYAYTIPNSDAPALVVFVDVNGQFTNNPEEASSYFYSEYASTMHSELMPLPSEWERNPDNDETITDFEDFANLNRYS